MTLDRLIVDALGGRFTGRATLPELKRFVVANLRSLKEHRANALLRKHYDRWGELSDRERGHVFRLEAELDRESELLADR